MCNTFAMDTSSIHGGSVKSDRLGHIKGYLVRFGDATKTDLEGDYFTASTDFGFPVGKSSSVPVNLYYHHGMDPVVGRKTVGTGFVKLTDEGLWYEAQVDMADEYGKMIARLAKAGKLGFSSGSASHLVERESKGLANEIIRWPIAEASVTPTPAEPRNAVKSLAEYYKDDMEDMEMEMEEVPPVPGDQTPEGFAETVFADVNMDIVHEGLEALYEALCMGIMGIAGVDANRGGYAVALIQGFADRAVAMVNGMSLDIKSVDTPFAILRPETLRGVERRLRDAIGLSRSESKRLAPLVWDALRDASPDTDIVDTPVVKTTVDRADILARLDALMELSK